jgi:rod shape determining protein RodA
MVIISSATHVNDSGSFKQFTVQIISFAIGLIIIAIMLLFDYNKIGKYHKYIYGLNVFLLLAVYIPGLGVKIAGANSWIKLGQ